jgi:hypothetical protein
MHLSLLWLAQTHQYELPARLAMRAAAGHVLGLGLYLPL